MAEITESSLEEARVVEYLRERGNICKGEAVNI